MKPVSKEELLEFAKKAKEGKGYLIQLHYPFHLPGQTNARELMFFAGLEQVQRWERELNKSKDKQLRQQIAAEKGNAIEVFRTFLDLAKGGLSVEGANQQLKEAGTLGKEWSQFTGQFDAKIKQSPDFRDLLQTFFQAGELRFATLDKQQKAVAQALDCFSTLGTAAIDTVMIMPRPCWLS